MKGEIRGWSLLKMKELKGNRTNLLIPYLRLWNVSAVSSYLKVTLFSFTFWCNISLQNLPPYHSSSIQEKDTWSCLYFPVLGTPLSHSEWYLYTLPVAAESSLKTKWNDTCTYTFPVCGSKTGNARDIFGARIRQQWPKIFTYSLIETFFGAAVKKKQDLMLKMYFPPAQKKNMYPPLVF